MAGRESPRGDPARDDDAHERVQAYRRLFGQSVTTYEAIAEASRLHARGAPVDTPAARWLPLGPRNVGGAVRCIAQRPGVPNELIAGSAQGGVWKSVDDGYSWRSVGAPELVGAVGAIAYAPSNPRFVYAGSGELFFQYPGGIGFFRSTDGGETFSRLVDGAGASPGSAAHYARIAVDPTDASRAWIASDTGLWRLQDTTFTAEALPAPAAGQPVTDVAIAIDPADPAHYVLLVGVATIGVARGLYDRARGTIAWTVVGPGAPAPWAGGIGVVRVAWSSPAPALVAYTIMEDKNAAAVPSNASHPTAVFRSPSPNAGLVWAAPPFPALPAVPPPGPPLPPPVPTPPFAEHVNNPLYSSPGQADYSLTIAVNPRNAQHVVVGCLDVHSSVDGGQTWTAVLESTLYDNGDRAQHADQSHVIFDATRANTIWVANDGGVSFCADCTVTPVVHVPRPGYLGATLPSPKPVWRKRSFGISAAQLVDVTTHPLFPSIVGGGFQDNGTWVSYGGPSWYALDTADGGSLGMHPTSPFRFYASWQGGVDRVDVSQFPPVPAPPPPVLPPLDAASLPDVPGPANVHSPFLTVMQNVPNGRFFIRASETHATTADFLLTGGANALLYATDAVNYATANLPGLAGNVTSVSFAPNSADMWAGSDQGELYVFGGALPPTAPPVAAQPAWTTLGAFPGTGPSLPVAAIAVHPTNASVVAVCTALAGGGAQGGLFLSHDRGATWVSLVGTANALPPGPFLAVEWDPVSTQTLFVGTVAGTYVARDLPAVPLAAAVVPNPTWRTFNAGLPLVPVTDLTVTPVARTLRCATFGRGAFEVTLTGVTPPAFALPGVSLVVRDHAADDGRVYPAASTLGGDPRVGTVAAPPAPPAAQPAAAPNAAGPIDVTHSPDIAIDSPRFARFEAFAFGEAIDGVEFDENLVRDEPLVGDENIVYVQVQNRGTDTAINVDVHLYFANAGNPVAPPAIPADLGFPNAPPAGSAWQRVDVITVGEIRPGEPVVVTFRWTPPLSIVDNAALLAVVTTAQDALGALAAGAVATVVGAERRAALHVTHVQRDTIFIRDGLDDTGEKGAVPWGGRSPDIVVRQAQVPAANLVAEFADLAASHAEDRAKVGANFVYVRVSNRTQTIVPRSVVQLFVVPRAAIMTPGVGWTAVAPTVIAPPAGVVLTNIPAGGSLVAEFALTLPADPDPDAVGDGKGVILLAMANVTDAAGTTELDPFPDIADVTSVEGFWRFFTGAPLATNAALRALRVAP